MNPLKIIEKYYDPGSAAYAFLTEHSRMVTEKALKIAGKEAHLHPDLLFIQEAAMLHDIGIFLTDEPKLGCFGDKPYICHGYLGREILEREGFPLHALVCERHVGVGISTHDIRENKLPLPERDMEPVSIEEQIICFADKFYSKDSDFLLKEKTPGTVRKSIARFGQEKLARFDEWCRLFEY